MWELPLIVIVLLVLIFYEYRLRRPDQLILAEKRGDVIQRRGRFYPRHFSLALPRTIHSLKLRFTAEVRGKLLVDIRIALATAASVQHLSQLIRVGGWDKQAVAKASEELTTLLESKVKTFSEQLEMEEITCDRLSAHLSGSLGQSVEHLGLDIVTLTVQSIEPVDKQISEAMQQLETARILEQTEEANQHARITAAKVRIKADDQIARAEHELELKKYALRKKEQEQEAVLARLRTEEELKRRRLQLDFERREVELIRQSPELLLLTPQVARLAEASQQLKNARTVVSLSGNEGSGSQIVAALQTLIQNLLPKSSNPDNG